MGPSSHVTVFLETLWGSIKQVKAPYLFDGEYGIALHEMQENQASSHGEGEVSWFFTSCSGILGYILELRQGWTFKRLVCTLIQDSCLVTRDTSGISSRLGREIGTLL